MISNYESNSTISCTELIEPSENDSAATVDVFFAPDYWTTHKFKEHIREKNYQTAWIHSYFKNKPVALKDALAGNVGTKGQQRRMKKRSNRKNTIFKESGVFFRIRLNATAEMEEKSINEAEFIENLCEIFNTYSLANSTFGKKSCKKLKKDMRKLGDDGFLILREGNRDYWEIDKLKKFMRNKGLQTTFLVAFKDGKRIPIKDVLTQIN
ncbi:MAG: hypothetical protein RLN90_10410 [Balneolaceae bacterium]